MPAAACTAASAHGAAPGLGNFIGGFIHPLLEPAQFVALVALALLVGQQSFKRTENAVWALGITTAIGVVAATLSAYWAGWVGTDTLLLLAAGVTGILVAVAKPVPVPVYVLLAALIGLGSGLESGPDGLEGGARIGFMIGALLGTCAWLGDAGLLVQACHRAWGKVLIRVVGSWMTACAIIVLTLQLAVPPKVGTACANLNLQGTEAEAPPSTLPSALRSAPPSAALPPCLKNPSSS